MLQTSVGAHSARGPMINATAHREADIPSQGKLLPRKTLSERWIEIRNPLGATRAAHDNVAINIATSHPKAGMGMRRKGGVLVG